MEMRPHPLNDDGLAIQPPDVELACNPAECKYAEPFKDTQHVYRPRTEYKTTVEKEFRRLGCFVIEMCRCMHERWDNTYQAPPKPPVPTMKKLIDRLKNGNTEL